MIRRLKIKFVCITMSIVTVILLCVLAAVLGLTRASLQRESLRTMWQIALNPARPQAPDEEFNGMRLPYFVLEVDRDGRVQQAGGGYYDLSDTEFLQNAVEQALLPFEPVYYEKGLGLDVNLCPGVRVRGNAEQLRRVAAILLDNGQKYAAPASVVHVSLCREGRQAVLSVTSRGDTIPPEELPKLFKRFYRADPDHRHGDGCGLGLAIAQQIVTAHRGRIRAANDQGINTFSVIRRPGPARPRFAARLPGQ